jgi:hypothetical protein
VIRSFLALGVVLIALVGVAHADTASEAKKLTNDALARFDAANTKTGKIWALIDGSAHDNLVNAKDHVVESKADVDKQVKAGEEIEAELKLNDLKTSIRTLDTEIDSYNSYMKGTQWKLYGGAAAFILLVFGGSIWMFIKRKTRR